MKPELAGPMPFCVRIAGQMGSWQLLVTRSGRVTSRGCIWRCVLAGVKVKADPIIRNW